MSSRSGAEMVVASSYQVPETLHRTADKGLIAIVSACLPRPEAFFVDWPKLPPAPSVLKQLPAWIGLLARGGHDDDLSGVIDWPIALDAVARLSPLFGEGGLTIRRCTWCKLCHVISPSCSKRG